MIVKFSLVLSKKGQAEDGRRQVVDYLTARGLEPTGGGFATLSFAAKSEAFDDVFHSTTKKLKEPLYRHPKTVGASAPQDEPPIETPEELIPFVEHVSIAPPATRFSPDM